MASARRRATSRASRWAQNHFGATRRPQARTGARGRLEQPATVPRAREVGALQAADRSRARQAPRPRLAASAVKRHVCQFRCTLPHVVGHTPAACTHTVLVRRIAPASGNFPPLPTLQTHPLTAFPTPRLQVCRHVSTVGPRRAEGKMAELGVGRRCRSTAVRAQREGKGRELPVGCSHPERVRPLAFRQQALDRRCGERCL